MVCVVYILFRPIVLEKKKKKNRSEESVLLLGVDVTRVNTMGGAVKAPWEKGVDTSGQAVSAANHAAVGRSLYLSRSPIACRLHM